ncbi:MAG: type IV pilus assembly protein PilW [Nitrospirae bacterium]|nr:MAG: type IV pilus assembly protein PilW [Nitrospirota bacterium]
MRKKAFSVQHSALSIRQAAYRIKKYTLHAIRYTLSKKGTSLVELLITLTVFSIIGAMMFSTYSTFLKQVTVERKKTKTELDIFNVSWPLIKEIETAGFGVPKTITPISEVGGELTIRSTAAGDSQYAGAWSYVIATTTTNGAVYGIDGTVGPGVPTGGKVVIVNILDKSRMGLDTVSTNASGGGYYYLTAGTSAYVNNVAYWSPYDAAATLPLEYYETKYSLRDYDPPSDPRPAMCAPDGAGATEKVKKLSRSVKDNNPGTTYFLPLLDCVRALAFRFGCIDASGNLTWQSGTDCGTAKLRLMKIGMIIQASAKGGASPATITLFEDLGAALASSTNLTNEQRNYKWRKLEQTITLKNQE